MIQVIAGQQEFIRQCETCKCTVAYVFTDLKMRKTKKKTLNGYAFGAYHYAECPTCKQDIRH